MTWLTTFTAESWSISQEKEEEEEEEKSDEKKDEKEERVSIFVLSLMEKVNGLNDHG